MKIQLALVFAALTTSTCWADVGEMVNTLTTLSGRTYRGVTIAQIHPDGVSFRHASGAGKVLFADLPADLRQQLGYDAKKAEAYEKDLAAKREKVRLALIERDKEIARAQARASEAAAAQAQAQAMQVQYLATGGGDGWNYAYPLAYDWYGYGWQGRDSRLHRRPDGSPVVYGSNIGHPFSAGQTINGPAYSGATHGARFTNGVPALGASFVAQPVRQAPVVGTGSRPAGHP